MHGDVEQEGLYQNCVFHYRWGRLHVMCLRHNEVKGAAPRFFDEC
jgi:hypothetical protein